MKNRFNFYEVVVVNISCDYNTEKLIGEEGVILGMSQDEDNGQWSYAVSMSSTGAVWSLYEQQLATTGKYCNRADIYSGESVKVIVDQNTGRGEIN